MNTLSISSTPLNTSSAGMSFAFFFPNKSPNARKPLVNAARKPASLGADPGEEIGLRAGELIDACRVELCVGAEDVRIGGESGCGAAAVGGGADFLKLRRCDAA